MSQMIAEEMEFQRRLKYELNAKADEMEKIRTKDKRLEIAAMLLPSVYRVLMTSTENAEMAKIAVELATELIKANKETP